MNELTADTGDNTGWAYWPDRNNPVTGEIICPVKKIKDHFQQRIYMRNEFNELLTKYHPSLVVLEGVKVYRNVQSMTAATRGNLMKLSYLVSTYESCCMNYGILCQIILAEEWKGQLDKKQTANRIFQVIGQQYENSHITDAVGIGLHLQGRLLWDNL